MTQDKWLDNILDNLDLVREDIGELDLDRAIQRVSEVLSELVRINAGVTRGESLESATTFTKPRVPDLDGVQSDTVDRQYLDERHWVV